jgi:hypothetical protein
MDLAGRPEVFRTLLVLGALLVAGLAVALRALRRRVALDEAEEVLRAEYEECDRAPAQSVIVAAGAPASEQRASSPPPTDVRRRRTGRG